MQIHIFDSPEQVSHAAATLMAAQLLHKPFCVVGVDCFCGLGVNFTKARVHKFRTFFF